MLTQIVNSKNGIEKFTLKYFTSGHTFMSADNFHRNVEREMKKKGDVYDFNDFKPCVGNAGEVSTMEIKDFSDCESGLSQGKESREIRPYLHEVVVAEFCRGSTNMFYKKLHNDKEFLETYFLKKKTRNAIAAGSYNVSHKSTVRGVSAMKRKHIIANLGPLMPKK